MKGLADSCTAAFLDSVKRRALILLNDKTVKVANRIYGLLKTGQVSRNRAAFLFGCSERAYRWQRRVIVSANLQTFTEVPTQ